MSPNEMQVSLEDQKRINEYASVANQREKFTVELGQITRNMETNKDALIELEMVLDEDEPVMQKCGTGFLSLPYDEAVRRVNTSIEDLTTQLKALKDEAVIIESRGNVLKGILNTKFGDAIQLEM